MEIYTLEELLEVLHDNGYEVEGALKALLCGIISYKCYKLHVEVMAVMAALGVEATSFNISSELEMNHRYVQSVLRKMNRLYGNVLFEMGKQGVYVWKYIKDVKRNASETLSAMSDGREKSEESREKKVESREKREESRENNEVESREKNEVESLSPTAQLIVRMMLSDASVTTARLSSSIGVCAKAIEKQVRRLREMGIVRREGGRKRGLWRVGV